MKNVAGAVLLGLLVTACSQDGQTPAPETALENARVLHAGTIRFDRNQTNLDANGPVNLRQEWRAVTGAVRYRVVVTNSETSEVVYRGSSTRPVAYVVLVPQAPRGLNTVFDCQVIAEDRYGRWLADGTQQITLTVR